MADASVSITAGSGTGIDTRTEATNGNHRQVVVLGDPSTNAGVAPVDVTHGLSIQGGVAHGGVDSAKPIKTGSKAITALPTAEAASDVVDTIADKFGRTVFLNGTIRDLVGTQTTTISASVAETTIVTAAASTFNDLTLVTVSNTSGTATRVDFRDTTAGSVLFSLYVPAGDVRGFAPPRPIPQTSVNTNWTAQSSTSVTDLRVYCTWDKNK
jgi:hypothetical protein